MTVNPEPPSLPSGHALVVDDHPLVARGITEFLRAHPRLSGAFGVGNALEALASVEAHGAPAIALVDFWMADGASTAFISALRTRAPTVRILSMSGDGHAVVRRHARTAGAHGFIHKQQAPEVFAAAVTRLLDGGTWFDGDADEAKGAERSRDLPLTPADLGLTARQGEVLARLLDGQPNKRIAQALAVSESTVKEHVTGILQRLGVSTRIEVIARFRDARLELPCAP